jgi:O-antigen ligase
MSNRVATVVLQLGIIAVVFAALPYKLFELDRYLVPKELVLHVVALVLAVVVLARARTMQADTADKLLAVFLIVSGFSAVFATSYWLAQRALSLSIASAIVFWATRRLGAEGSYRPILSAAAVATTCAAVVGLSQAYGLETAYFSLNRAPGGTFGNRNFVAHFCAIGLPVLVFATITARHSRAALMGTLSCGAVVALLVLSRSRAAWLSVAATAAVALPALVMSRRFWTGHGVGGRFARIGLTAVVASAGAVFLPNSLNWNSDSPYLDSALRIADYSSGSGRGRIAQYLNSGRMALSDPVLGVGPGNWSVLYPRFAPAADKSLAEDGRTANPWPSSDWVAFVSERGVLAALCLLSAFSLLFFAAFRGWPELGSSEAVLARLASIGTIVATLVVSAFDAVLLLGAPALLAWSVIGATSGIGRQGRDVIVTGGVRLLGALGLLLVQAASVARSAAQVNAIALVGTGWSRAGWVAGADWDPGSYRANLRAAELLANARRCAASRTYARRALALAPDAAAARRVLRACR